MKHSRHTLHVAAVHWTQQPKPGPQWRRLMNMLLGPRGAGPASPTNEKCPPTVPQDLAAGKKDSYYERSP